MTDPAERILDDPRLLGAVMVQLTIIAGEMLRTATAESGADPQEVLRSLVERRARNLGIAPSPWLSATPLVTVTW